MIKLESYSVSGYKNIQEAEVQFNNLNVIIGPNNSGKSNFIQSISFINYLINAPTDDLQRSFTNGFFNSHFKEIIPLHIAQVNEDDMDGKDIPGNEIFFQFEFSNSETNHIFHYRLEMRYKTNIFEVSYKIHSESLDVKSPGKPGKASNVFTRTNGKVKYGSDSIKTNIFQDLPDFISVIRILKIAPLLKSDHMDAIMSLNAIVKTPTFYFSNTELLKSDSTDRLSTFNGRTVAFDLEKEIINLENGSNWEIFKSALKDILNIEHVEVHSYFSGKTNKDPKTVRKYLFLEHFGTRKSIREMSDGTILIIALVTKILNSSNDIFFIEEPENSIHPRALVDLFSFLQSFSLTKQFIITSHSIALLNKTKMEDIIISCINESGLTDIHNVSDRKELKAKLKSGFVNFSDELFFGNQDDDEFE